MSVHITINKHKVTNPIAKLIVMLVGLTISIVIIALLFFILLPFIWFVGLTIVLMILAIALFSTRSIDIYRIVIKEKNASEQKDRIGKDD
jgi:uncharacterized protein YacL